MTEKNFENFGGQYTTDHSSDQLIQMYGHPDVPGLFYWPNCIPEDLQRRAIDYIASDDVSWKNVGGGAHSRRASHTGYDYDYKSGAVTESDPIPDVFRELADIATECCSALKLGTQVFNQCLLNEYLAGHSQGISWHTDHRIFGPVIACFTVGSGTEMQFRNGDGKIISVRVEPGSLYLMSGLARSAWQHSMPGRKSDPNPDSGPRIQRGDRYSITYRVVP